MGSVKMDLGGRSSDVMLLWARLSFLASIHFIMKITRRSIVVLLLLAGCHLNPFSAEVWTDPETAAEENPDFLIQGEYLMQGEEAKGVQIVALGSGNFNASHYQGGLPGQGWDGSAIESVIGNREAMTARTEGFERLERESTTLGQEPPEGAVVLFDGSNVDAWKGGKITEEGYLDGGTESKADFGDFKLHLEFRVPFKPDVTPSDQDRGNSGVYIFGRYEIQILDTFGLDVDVEKWSKKPESGPKQWCGSIYTYRVPDVNVCYPPLRWQTYDLDFTAPRFEDDKKVKNARLTLRMNGVVVHDDIEVPSGTGAGRLKAEVATGPIQLQAHGNPVVFRNIWIQPKE